MIFDISVIIISLYINISFFVYYINKLQINLYFNTSKAIDIVITRQRKLDRFGYIMPFCNSNQMKIFAKFSQIISDYSP